MIRSKEHLIAHVAGLLERAKGNLQRDGDLLSVVLFETHDNYRMDACIGCLSAATVTAHIRGVVRKRPDVELVTFISLAYGVTPEQFERLPKSPAHHPDKATLIGAESSHVDFGYVRMHVEYGLNDGKFSFKQTARSSPGSTPPPNSFLIDLWPKRKLNS